MRRVLGALVLAVCVVAAALIVMHPTRVQAQGYPTCNDIYTQLAVSGVDFQLEGEQYIEDLGIDDWIVVQESYYFYDNGEWWYPVCITH